MMEIDPHYCSVIIERWESFTGKKASKQKPRVFTEERFWYQNISVPPLKTLRGDWLMCVQNIVIPLINLQERFRLTHNGVGDPRCVFFLVWLYNNAYCHTLASFGENKKMMVLIFKWDKFFLNDKMPRKRGAYF